MVSSMFRLSFHASRSIVPTRRFSTTVSKHAELRKLGVLGVPYEFCETNIPGAGQMGLGIALVAARNAKLNVTLMDKDPNAINKSIGFMSIHYSESG